MNYTEEESGTSDRPDEAKNNLLDASLSFTEYNLNDLLVHLRQKQNKSRGHTDESIMQSTSAAMFSSQSPLPSVQPSSSSQEPSEARLQKLEENGQKCEKSNFYFVCELCGAHVEWSGTIAHAKSHTAV